MGMKPILSRAMPSPLACTASRSLRWGGRGEGRGGRRDFVKSGLVAGAVARDTHGAVAPISRAHRVLPWPGMSNEFSAAERAALAPYFTNLDGPVFAL